MHSLAYFVGAHPIFALFLQLRTKRCLNGQIPCCAKCCWFQGPVPIGSRKIRQRLVFYPKILKPL